MACGTENRPGRKFCAQCGAPLGLTCAKCGTSNEPEERFCGECGAPLVAGALSISVPAPSAPPTAEPEGERKQLTVLFADVQGSMDLQEDLDPEVWAGIMGRFVAILAEGVRRYGGTVDKFTGDGIMALFGAPVAQEDHARRACHAALHLTKAIAAYAEGLRSSQGVDLQVRIGLNSGEVVVGRVGDDIQIDPTALGHTVGLAQRMEAMADPGTAYLAEHTARLVEDWFYLEDLGPMAVKGARAPIRVFVLEGPAPPPLAARAGRALAASPLVGRGRELAVLEDAMAAAAEGRAQVVGVVGDAGVGKSRLCEEFASSAAGQGITVRRTTGVSHGRETPLLPILALLRDYFSITDSDSPDQARDKLAGRLLDLDPALKEALPLLSDFLEVPDPDRPAPKLAPEVRMRRVFEVLHRMTARRSEKEVLVLLVEDLHWFDPQSEAFLERLVESFPGSRTLVVTNFRPEFSAAWMRLSYYRQLPLAPLRDEAVGELLGGLLGVDLSLAPLAGFVIERTAGNPFFIEEVVRSLVEDGTLAGGSGSYRLSRPLHEVKVPPSVQAVLAARIDRLPPEQKAVLQTAAVIGRDFAQAVLAYVTGLSDEALQDPLRALVAAELLQKAGHYPVAEFRFWHPLTQEVAYGTLLAGRRVRLHAAVAEAFVEHDTDRLDERAAVISWHWERASRPVEAARWNMRAGAWALRSDLADAQRRWAHALNLLDGVEESAESLALAVRARTRLIQFGGRTGIGRDEARRLFEDGQIQAERLGQADLRAMLVNVFGVATMMAGDLRGGLTCFEESTHLGEQVGDPGLRAVLAMGPAFTRTLVGPLDEALAWADRGIAVCEGDLERGLTIIGYSPLVRLITFRSEILLRTGRLAEARTGAARALADARRRTEPEILAWALGILPGLCWMTGEEDDQLHMAAEAVRIGEDTGNALSLVYGLEALARAHLVLGRLPEAVAAAERALAEARSRRSGLCFESEILACLAEARLAAGEPASAATAAAEAVAVARRQDARVVEGLALLTRARVARATDGGQSQDTVLADLDSAQALVRETGALTYEPFIREELGRLRDDEGELREALRLYSAIGATGHARRLGSELTTRSTSACPAPNTHLGL
ncbi:MAG TPA: adenylate/guanylate cyclase domain-containing protein [Acidimicrobiia bacterium]|nr:adenylate/guanylate cyclase domain-containing protein [Acidimicrobiia bacterium]